MKETKLRIEPVSETSWILYLGEEIDVHLAPLIGQFSERIANRCPEVIEVTPSYTSILVELDVLHADFDKFPNRVRRLHSELVQGKSDDSSRLHLLPVYYSPEVAPDLIELADHCGVPVEEVIRLHSSCEYHVCAIGFAPGFAFLAELDERIAHPRKTTPRKKVAAGSVGIADRQTAVYPSESPGGWQIIGRCPELLFDRMKDPVSPFVVGDRVKFEPISKDEYLRAGGEIGNG
ncbi:5-oxoprolinase subunit PxpB [Verrucomicrobiaceae bacterium N1E253]|uniref:5-oxoprolinase subunit PxpB n=2 Tax=Oceaniferula marina TaxID=2748318 RepID=A0A851GE74_9BACT|nr:5-oxoprolinase subunit PxpB [Oceaniferula marina]